MAPCPERGVALFLYITKASSSGEGARRREFFCLSRWVEEGSWRRIVKKRGKEVKK